MAERPVRRRRHATRVVAEREATRLELLIKGDLKIEDLDDEEILRMQLKNSNGDFRGRPPLWVPRAFALEMRAEFTRRFQGELNNMLPKALKAHKEILDSRHLAPGDAARMTAVKEVYDRTFGKVVQQTEVHATVEKKDFSDVVADVVMDLDMEEDDE
ncbi:hypothetical protein SEA_KARATE_4 [Microbacterium phage Karate]|nr:hypothetical protein SEA_KARATE_4 [Microbacterium phage Karate]